MKTIIFCILASFVLASCSYYAPTAQIQENKNINTEELADISEK